MQKRNIIAHALLFIISISCQAQVKRFVNDPHKDVLSVYPHSAFIHFPFHDEYLDTLLEKGSGTFFEPYQLADSHFHSLNALQHFIYAFNHPESYYQSCTSLQYVKNLYTKIPAYLRRPGEGLQMSQRQESALTAHRDSTIILLGECINQAAYVPEIYLSVILRLQAYELIPTLIRTIDKQEPKDPYIMTLLALLMRNAYKPFIQSRIYHKLYSEQKGDKDWIRPVYENFIPFTHTNYQRLLTYASDYYTHSSRIPPAFITIEAGNYELGQGDHSINPARKVSMDAFHISRYEITNAQFERFVTAAEYVTLAEKRKDALVFRLGLAEFEWQQDTTANWRFPNGKSQGGIEDKMDHPVTCISYVDAQRYCAWARVRLPSIEQWEIASRANSDFRLHHFGDSLEDIYDYANIWHGKTHLMEYEGEDYLTTSPVGSFKPNLIGLYDMYGNVFEFCANLPEAFQDFEQIAATRGGSWWCSFHACGFFNSIDIGRVHQEASFSNHGFRVIL